MLIVSGSSAEQPSPARAKAPTDASGACFGSTAITRNAPASRNGRMWYVARLGSQRWIAANRTRPAVTTAQNAVSATAAVVDATPSEVMSSWDQLPFMVSQNPYRIANAPNSQSPAGIRPPVVGDPAACCDPPPVAEDPAACRDPPPVAGNPAACRDPAPGWA